MTVDMHIGVMVDLLVKILFRWSSCRSYVEVQVYRRKRERWQTLSSRWTCSPPAASGERY